MLDFHQKLTIRIQNLEDRSRSEPVLQGTTRREPWIRFKFRNLWSCFRLFGLGQVVTADTFSEFICIFPWPIMNVTEAT